MEKPHSEDSWISAQELKELDEKLWEDLVSISKRDSFQVRENDAGGIVLGMFLYLLVSCI